MDEDQTEKPISRDRYEAQRAAAREAAAKVGELEGTLTTAQARIAELEAQAQELAALRQQFDAARGDWETERALWQVGIADPEGIEVARLFHQKLPADGRPKIGEWLATLKADPSQAPRALAAYLQGGAEAPKAAEAAPPKVDAPRATIPAPAPQALGGLASSGSAPVLDAAAIRALTEQARKSGDYSQLREAMPAIRASLGRSSV